MKRILLIMCFLLTGSVFSQQIEIKDGRFYLDGQHVYKHEIKETLKANEEALLLFQKSRTKESFGGFLLGAGIGLVVGDVVKGLVSDAKYPSGFTYVGAGLAVISIPILSGRTKMLHKSIDLYNESVQAKKSDLGYHFEVNMLGNQNGIGLNISF